ncbi:acetyl-CoA carboxylase biotin carboxylase subunit family protein [Actinomadura sp. 6N118]|uniref:acetyl-CoA carboxylase biotin carboxylase subunit family protein n=1 Tax=Actinomadura sp. 6N118 TaxID=3375151 RepID=UPI0037A5155F
MPRYLVLNRFDDEFGEYHRFVPTKDHRLAYITLRHGLPILNTEGALDTVVVDDLGFETVLPVARRLSAALGPFDGVVGLSERDVLTAARLRTELGLPGWTPEFVNAFRDKPRMKEIIGAAGLPVPRFRTLDEDTTAEQVVADLGLPVILKPRDGAGSKGVVLAHTVAGLAEALASTRSSQASPGGHECEEYVAGDIFHVDGIRRGGLFHFVSASVYVNTCLDFMDGVPLGSLLLDEGRLRDRLIAFASRCLDALGLRDGPFHLEVFGRPDGELVFLEIGLRPGGAEVAFIHRDLFGIDLFGEAFRATLGLPPLTPREAFRPTGAGGWVSVPEPRPLPSRVLSRTPLVGVVPEVYAEVLPDVGSIFDGTGGYDHIGGRFRLRGSGQDAVRRAVLEVMARYELIAEPIGRAGCATWGRMPAHQPKGG